MTKNAWIKMWIWLLAVEAIICLVFGIINAPLLTVLVRGSIAGKTAAGIQIFGGILTLFVGK